MNKHIRFLGIYFLMLAIVRFELAVAFKNRMENKKR